MARGPKKGGPTALQVEITNDEDWAYLLERKGLTLVDVFSDWSGPCAAMVTTLRRIKMDIAGDVINYAVARNDEVADLERFRGRSEPVWMFIEGGKMVNLMFGANCPKLQKTLTEEIKRVQQSEAAKWCLPVSTRAPEEEVRWQHEEAIRKASEEKRQKKEDAEKKEKYEAFLAQMMFELSEETALVLYPWVFKDADGHPKDKIQSQPYMELVHDLLRQRFDILEELRIELTEEMAQKLFVESGVEVTEEIVAGLTDGKIMAMRLKGKPPHPDWPVPYPHECTDGREKCPKRAMDDVENYLHCILHDQPPPVSTIGATPVKSTISTTFIERNTYTRESDPNIEGDKRRVYPAAWAPPQARSKVHVFKTLFPTYMDHNHPYEEPEQPPSLCTFKFDATKFGEVRDAFENFFDAIEMFGVFEYDKPPYAKRIASSPAEFERKPKYKTGKEIFILIIRFVSEEAFLTFASMEPYFITEDTEETEAIIEEYFSSAVDVHDESSDEEEYYGEEEEEYRDAEEEDEEEKEQKLESDLFPFF